MYNYRKLMGNASTKTPGNVATSVMIDPDLLALVKKLAKAERRSVSAQVCVLLDEALKETK